MICGLFISFFSIVFFPYGSDAAGNDQTQINPFSCEALLPKNQQNGNKGYFDLLMKPGEKQIVQLKVSNYSSKPLEIEIQINSAKTNGNGVIQYGQNELKKDNSLRYDLAKLVTGPKKVTLPANSSELVDFQIILPEKAFEGYLAGGIQLKQMGSPDKKQEEQAMIINKFAYVVGLLISESAVKKTKPELELNNVSLKLKDARHYLFVNLSNVKAMFIKKMSVRVKIKKADQEQILLEYEKNGMSMAPNTMIDLPVPLMNKEVSSGEYTAEIHVSEESGQRWTWIKNFELMKVEANKINLPEAKERTFFSSYYWLLGLFGIVAVVATLKFIYLKQI